MAGFVGVHHQLGPVPAVELGEHVADVGLHGAVAEVQLRGDFMVGESLGDGEEYVALAVGQSVSVGRRLWRGKGGEPFDQPLGDARVQQRVTARDHLDGLEELGRASVLEQESTRARPQGLQHQVVLVEGGEHHDAGTLARRVGQDGTGRRQAVEVRHSHVHEHHVGRCTPAQRNGLQPVAGLADHFDVRRGTQQQHESGTHQVLVIDDGDPDHPAAPVGSVAWTRKPSPWAPYSTAPPTIRTRSSSPPRPRPDAGMEGADRAGPGSVTSRSSMAEVAATVTVAVAAAECLITLVSDSWTIRNPVSETAALTCGAAPERTRVTSRPADRTSSTRVAMSSRPCAGGRVPSSASSRSIPSIDRVSSSARRLVSAMTFNACLAAGASMSIRWAPTPACTAISDILCATTSCSSLAIRSRSSVTAARRWSACKRRRDRTAFPTAQAASRRARAWSRSEAPRSGTSSSASPMKQSIPTPRPINAWRRRPCAASEYMLNSSSTDSSPM